MIVIVINGPTCSGKDTLVDALAERITNRDVLYFTPKHLLCKWVGSKYGLNPKSVWQINADKEVKWDKLNIFGGLSVMEALIDVSENDIKKNYGEEGVIRLGLDDFIKDNQHVLKDSVVLIDNGFNSEYEVIKEVFEPHGVVNLVRITRKGYSFDGDSREFIEDPRFIFKNDGTIDEFLNYAIPMIIAGCGISSDYNHSKGIKFSKDI
jgi:hypothetical protein